jgi:hypothetical protein
VTIIIPTLTPEQVAALEALDAAFNGVRAETTFTDVSILLDLTHGDGATADYLNAHPDGFIWIGVQFEEHIFDVKLQRDGALRYYANRLDPTELANLLADEADRLDVH